jgi:hypothetical protein
MVVEMESQQEEEVPLHDLKSTCSLGLQNRLSAGATPCTGAPAKLMFMRSNLGGCVLHSFDVMEPSLFSNTVFFDETKVYSRLSHNA